MITDEFYFIRHGSTDWNRSLIGKDIDYKLNEQGIRESHLAGLRMQKYLKKSNKPNLIISSSLNRAKDSSAIISKYLNAEIKCNSSLNERYFGKGDDAEKDNEFHSRIKGFIEIIIQETSHYNLILLSHFHLFYELAKIIYSKTSCIESIKRGDCVLFSENGTKLI